LYRDIKEAGSPAFDIPTRSAKKNLRALFWNSEERENEAAETGGDALKESTSSPECVSKRRINNLRSYPSNKRVKRKRERDNPVKLSTKP